LQPIQEKRGPKNYTLELAIGQLLPELDDALLSMNVGEEKEVMAKFPDDYGDKALAGSSATVSVQALVEKKSTSGVG